LHRLRLGSPRGTGFGDVKLTGVLGMYVGWLGWSAWTLSLLTAALYAGAVASSCSRTGAPAGAAASRRARTWSPDRGLVGQQLLDGAVTLQTPRCR